MVEDIALPLKSKKHTILLTSFAEQQPTESMNKASIEAKEFLHRNGQIGVLPGTSLSGEIPQTDVSVDGLWGSRGSSSRQGMLTYVLRKTVKFLILS